MKLKECPFCGGEVEMTKDCGDSPESIYSVGCLNDGCPIHVFTKWYRTQDEAREAWNRRAVDIKVIKPNIDEIGMKIKKSAKFMIEVLNNIIEELDYKETDYAYVKQLMITAYCTFKNIEVLVEDTDCLKSKEK